MDKSILIAAITAVICMGSSALGASIASVFGRSSKRILSIMLAFASGLTIGLVCFDLIVESIEGFGESFGVIYTVLFILIGYALIYLINLAIDRRSGGEHCCHCHCHEEEEPSKSPRQLFRSGVVMAIAIALHNLPVGMLIGGAFASSAASIFESSALPLTLVIGLHNIPEGMAISLPLISGGAKRSSSVLITALTGLPTAIGAILGYCIGSLNPLALSILLCFAAGAMLYVVLSELLPEAYEECHSKLTPLAVVLGILTAFIIIFA